MKVKRYLNIDSPYTGEVGIEIELEGRYLILPTRAGEFWQATGDGSLRGNEAIEYVMRSPAVRGEVRDQLKILQQDLEDAGSELDPSERCGVHVHIDCRDLSYNQVFNIALLYLLFEDLLLEYCGPERVNNLFCLSSKHGNGLLMALAYARKKRDMHELMFNEFRYSSINFTSLKKYGTLEFRGFRSTANFSEIADWVELLLCLKDEAIKMKDPRHLVENVSQQGAYALLEMVFKDKAERLTAGKQPHNIERTILSSARQVQHICYAKFDEEELNKQFENNVKEAVTRLVPQYYNLKYSKEGTLAEMNARFYDCNHIFEPVVKEFEESLEGNSWSRGSQELRRKVALVPKNHNQWVVRDDAQNLNEEVWYDFGALGREDGA